MSNVAFVVLTIAVLAATCIVGNMILFWAGVLP